MLIMSILILTVSYSPTVRHDNHVGRKAMILMDISVIVNQLIELFLIICLGYVLFKANIMNEEFNKKLTTMLLNVTLPSMILASVLKQTEKQALGTVMTVFAVSIILYAVILPLLGFVIVKLMRVKKSEQGLYIFMNIFSNIGFMGFPVINALYGAEAIFYAAIFNLIFNLLAYTIGVPIMRFGSGEKHKFSFKNLLTPGVILSLLAIIIYFLPINCPEIIANAVDTVGSITSPAAMLLIGATLAKMDIKKVFNNWRVYVYSILKQVAVPLLLWIPLKYFIPDEFILKITLIMLAMPVANTAVLFATEYDGDEELAAKTVFITTLMSLVTIPVTLAICF